MSSFNFSVDPETFDEQLREKVQFKLMQDGKAMCQGGF